jgi:hypothetical protein
VLKNITDIKTHSKWCVNVALIFIAVLGGILGQQQVAVPNQEIVLQFTNADISLNDTRHTIAIVEEQLELIGVYNIQVSEQENGKLIISYYSNTDVDGIKALLSKQRELALGFISFDNNEKPIQLPSDNASIGYNLDVYEIKDGQNLVSDLGGKSAIELKSGHYRFVNTNFYIPSDDIIIAGNEQILKVNYTFQRHLAITKDCKSYKIPEVRAGPSAKRVQSSFVFSNTSC